MHLILNNFKSSKFIKLSKAEILNIVEEVLKTVEYKFTKNHQLNLSFVSSEEMKLLNKTYRNKDKPTNVLSFEMPKNFPVGDEKTLIGEIALCEEIIYEESKKYKKIFENRLKHMIIHGLLHLIGFDHVNKDEGNKMESVEKKIMKSISAGDPY
ncbi:MAG: rRNA maturation RNase YbeY [Gammaproteobacteria bacterium]|nr:MAG: rRNA maturation RNase YbeY [Gammaproteobacteria bacterium]|tara:strand:+ start:1010 stop:1471 length:462 start_codon:yes stop_codon:yes gene_type:complete